MSKTYSAGIVTAYGAAKRAGYQGTYEDFCRQQAGYAESAATVEQAKNTAVSAASTATTKAGEAATAATAAQTAKTQTEQASSQALTDIATARSGAISAVQTEGQTQTANASAAAQAAATSATTASTKASEASASATSAGRSATNAAASATNAASSASAAQGVLESIPSDYSQMSADVTQLKADLDELETYIQYPLIDVISNASISSSGVVSVDATHDLYLQEVSSIYNIDISITGEISFVYAFFSSKPTMESVSVNSSRTYVNSASTTNITVPSSAKWIGVRVLHGTSATITKKSAVIEDLITKVSTLITWESVTGTQILNTNYSFRLPDANNAATNSSYVLTFPVGSTSIPANLPVSTLTQPNSLLLCIGKGSASRVQLFVMGDNVWGRSKVNATTWGSWYLISGTCTIRIGATRHFTTLKSGIEEAIKTNGSKVIVDPGTYDLLTEFATEIADTSTWSGYRGIKLENNVDITFLPGAFVTFLYTGNNTNVNRYFSPFYAGGNGGFKIDGLHITASNCRYAVHEDARGVTTQTQTPRNVVIKNSFLYLDNTANTYGFNQCIGGGLTDFESIELISNYMETKAYINNAGACASWHNCIANSSCSIVAKDNYCSGKGTLKFNSYGTSSADTSTVLASGNSVGSALVNGYENQGSYPNRNLKVIAWNNEIR